MCVWTLDGVCPGIIYDNLLQHATPFRWLLASEWCAGEIHRNCNKLCDFHWECVCCFCMVYFWGLSLVSCFMLFIASIHLFFALKNEWTRSRCHTPQQYAQYFVLWEDVRRTLLLCGEHFAAVSINFSTEQNSLSVYYAFAKSRAVIPLSDLLYGMLLYNKWVACTRKCWARSWNFSSNNWINPLKMKPYFWNGKFTLVHLVQINTEIEYSSWVLTVYEHAKT